MSFFYQNPVKTFGNHEFPMFFSNNIKFHIKNIKNILIKDDAFEQHVRPKLKFVYKIIFFSTVKSCCMLRPFGKANS